MAVDLSDELLTTFEGFSGTLLRPGETGYEEARHIHNAMIDKRPRLIAQCQGTADIVAALGFTREQGFELSVRGGGHNVAGKALTDGGVMVGLSRMKGIHVDPARRRARAEGGVTWAELNRETQLHALAVTGGVISTTGIAGLTLGGGLGWTMGSFGLASDNLVSAEVVTADGRVVTASEDEHADLFWALRGGGGNFGIVASFEYALHPVGPSVTGGAVIHPFPAAREWLRFVREFNAGVRDELSVFPGLIHAPDGSGAELAGALLCHIGSPEQAERDLAPLLEFGSPVDVQVGPMPYTTVNTLFDANFPSGLSNYWKSSFLRELSDEAIETMVDCFANCPSPMSAIVLEHFHGAATRIPVTATAVPHREPGYNFLLASIWPDLATDEENVTWTRETYASMEPFFATRRYVNYIPEDETGEDPIRAAYGPNYDRLVKVKNAYDPTNLLHLNQNIKPTL